MAKKKKPTIPQFSIVSDTETKRSVSGEKAGKELKELIKAINSRSKANQKPTNDSDLPPAA